MQLYRFLARRSTSKFNKIVLKRLYYSKAFKRPVSLSYLAREMKYKPGKTAVVVGSIVDDPRKLDLPKLNVAALHVTAAARKRITKAGGKIFTLDQLALKQPKGSNTVLLKGPVTHRAVVKHYGVPGHVGSKTMYVFVVL